MFRTVFAAIILLAIAAPAMAQDRVTLGIGRVYANDRTGDGDDRWRTGSYALSAVTGYGWDGVRPRRFGDIIELRFRSEIIAPGALNGPGSDDRPYVGALTFGVHSHMALGRGEFSGGVELTATGPQTGLGDFQDWFHDLAGLPRPSPEVLDDQIGDGFHPSLTVEYGHPFRLSGQITLRPFAEVQAGVEEIVRVGGDMVLGGIAHSDLLLRANTTGQLYRAVRTNETGFAVIAGVDWAKIGDSLYLPQSQGFMPEDTRTRARIGVHWQPEPQTALFYGLTWLSEEFVGQPEGQVLGAVTLILRF